MGMDLSHKVFIKKGKVLIRDSFQQLFLHLFRKVVPRIFKGKPPRFQDFGKLAKKIGLRVAAHGGNGSVFKGHVLVRDHKIHVKFHMHAKPHTVRTGPIRSIKGKKTGLDLRKGNVAVRTGKLFAVDFSLAANYFDFHCSFAKFQSRFQGFGQAPGKGWPTDETVDNDRNIMFLFLIKRDVLIKGTDFPIHLDPYITVTADFIENLLMLSLTAPYKGCQDHKFRTFRQFQDFIGNLLGTLALNDLSAMRTMGHANACKQKTQIIIDFRYRSHRRPRIAACSLLVNGNCGAEAANIIYIRLIHLSQKLAGIG